MTLATQRWQAITSDGRRVAIDVRCVPSSLGGGFVGHMWTRETVEEALDDAVRIHTGELFVEVLRDGEPTRAELLAELATEQMRGDTSAALARLRAIERDEALTALSALVDHDHTLPVGTYAALCFYCRRTVDGAAHYHAPGCAWAAARRVLAAREGT